MVNNLQNILETVKENICRHKTGSCDPLVYVLSSNLPKVLTHITIRFNFLEFKIRDQFHFEVNARGGKYLYVYTYKYLPPRAFTSEYHQKVILDKE